MIRGCLGALRSVNRLAAAGRRQPLAAVSQLQLQPQRRTLAKKASRPSGGDALELALKQVEQQYGKGSIMRLGSKTTAKVDVISTGSLSVDHALGIGGLPVGRIVEIFGPESSGKTTVALHVVAECQKQGGNCVFVDAEHALDPAYARNIGVDLDKLIISQPDDGEQALDIVETLVKSGQINCVVVDSVAALTPRAELEGEMGDHHIALQARLMSQALRKLTASISKTKCLVIFINQIRQKVGVMFGSNETTTGGNALRYYSSVRLEVRRAGQLKKDGENVGNLTRVKVAKNKMAPPFALAEFDMMYGSGVDKMGELVDLGIKIGVVKKGGAWFSCLAEDLKVANPTDAASSTIMLGQGKEKAKDFLRSYPAVAEALEAVVRTQLSQVDLTARDDTNDTPDEGEDAISDEDEAKESA